LVAAGFEGATCDLPIMDVFIGWSGERSAQLAKAVHHWLPRIIQNAHPFMSQRDIGAGADWSREIHERLDGALFGIICITAENISEPWINYETGALTNGPNKPAVCPLLLRLDPREITGPFTRLMAKVADHEGILQLVTSIAAKLPDGERVDPQIITSAFKMVWPNLQNDIEAIPETVQAKPIPDLIEIARETLSIVRDLARPPQRGDNWADRLARLYIPERLGQTPRYRFELNERVILNGEPGTVRALVGESIEGPIYDIVLDNGHIRRASGDALRVIAAVDQGYSDKPN
jgi:hypothetical protein